MKNAIKYLLPFALIWIATATTASEHELEKRIVQTDGWVAYQMPMTSEAGTPCCFAWRGDEPVRTGCDLDGREWNIGNKKQHEGSEGSMSDSIKDDQLKVYVRVNHARIEKVRAFAASCAIHSATPVRVLDAVDAGDSVALLAHVANESASEPREHFDEALAALAMHAQDSATSTLAQLADAPHPRKLREQSLFWLGQMRGADGAHIVEHVAISDGDPDLRAHAVFCLSQSHGTDAYVAIRKIATSDPSDHVREQALFWMAQMGDKRAQGDIMTAIEKDPSNHVREQAVFALSQLKDEQADAALIALVRGKYPREVKKQALFWLGQSGSDAAMQFLDATLAKTTSNIAFAVIRDSRRAETGAVR